MAKESCLYIPQRVPHLFVGFLAQLERTFLPQHLQVQFVFHIAVEIGRVELTSLQCVLKVCALLNDWLDLHLWYESDNMYIYLTRQWYQLFQHAILILHKGHIYLYIYIYIYIYHLLTIHIIITWLNSPSCSACRRVDDMRSRINCTLSAILSYWRVDR